MHFHLPKPLHGWREFVGEVGIIVVGVLIALAAEQVVESWQWDRKADAARRAITQELGIDAGVFDERAINAKCQEANGQQLYDVLAEARRTGRLPNIENIGGAPSRPMVTAAWNAATADGSVSHLPADFRNIASVVYPMIADYPHDLEDENQLWSVVKLANKAPGPTSETLLADISTALARVRYEARINDLIAEQNLDALKRAGVKPDYSFELDGTAARGDLLKFVQLHGCKPLLVNGKRIGTAEPSQATAAKKA